MRDNIKLIIREIEQIIQECDKQNYLIPHDNFPAKAAVLAIKEKVLEVKIEMQDLLINDEKNLKIENAPNCEIKLTSRELEVLILLSKGFSNKELAYRLSISDRTVQFHVKSLFDKFSASSRTEVVTKALSEGIISTKEL
ncbi:MAG: response regulator transcription factor [Oligoflexia bacterium]|nr:response regulator transcription factor [Oligoflexia bacterium]